MRPSATSSRSLRRSALAEVAPRYADCFRAARWPPSATLCARLPALRSSPSSSTRPIPTPSIFARRSTRAPTRPLRRPTLRSSPSRPPRAPRAPSSPSPLSTRSPTRLPRASSSWSLCPRTPSPLAEEAPSSPRHPDSTASSFFFVLVVVFAHARSLQVWRAAAVPGDALGAGAL